MKKVDIAIVGFGPVGATLAALLGQRGRTVAVYDKSADIYPLPRAFALDHEALRTFQQVGIADSMARHMTPYRQTLYQGADGQPIQHFDMGPAPYPLAWKPAYTFNQPALEAELRQAVRQLETVQVHLGHEVVKVEQDDELARLEVRAPDGATHVVGARYVVGCDGGASTVRKQAGLTLRSLDFDEPWVVIDLHVNAEILERLPQTNIQYCDPARPCTYVVGPGTHRRWEFLLLPHEAQQRDLPADAIWQLLAPWLAPHEAVLWRAATYRFHAVVAECWRNGRVLLAGDSAHQMPPFLAQGMCQGLRDASQLAWKLDAVLSMRAAPALLDTYGEERGPQVDEITRTVKRLGKIICERDPAQASARDAELRQQQGGTVKVQLRQHLLPDIHHGLIAAGGPPAGKHFPQAWVRDEQAGGVEKMDNLLPRDFLLFLLKAPAAADLLHILPVLDQLGGQLVCLEGDGSPQVRVLHETEGVLAGWFATHQCDGALVRPDHVVFGTAQGIEETVRLLRKARDALQ